MNASALIAEDEPILAAVLAQTLGGLWPGLHLLPDAPNGTAAVDAALAHRPDVLFLDIRMPGMSGLEAAEELAERWDGAKPFPIVVFVTAYDDYAVQAFEQAALDYVLKPVSAARLDGTVRRIQERLRERGGDGAMADLVAQMRALLPAAQAARHLDTIRAAVGNMVRLIPVQDVVYFQALDKYVNVVSLEGDALIRLPLKELLAQLDPRQFPQVSRGTIVNLLHVAGASRDDAGKLALHLRGRGERLRVSPLFAHLFRQM
ncbi:LytTR family DNA-binding domain-containing protein [Massilia sp. YIM B02763]|uniref:LytR/AlgR family response regulator transcription factor n=1 Tax=Massilia sp. YIM B02763 TaxID=3050130 RepID=UPI0025B6E42C|nr:LytTR family DNA-binding domain-containing protein [Massilia sp. YIM B02763]MDN4055048.1 LytTR family DNA-binding domain-containing protein [Massilia sp. YIM B02763]